MRVFGDSLARNNDLCVKRKVIGVYSGTVTYADQIHPNDPRIEAVPHTVTSTELLLYPAIADTTPMSEMTIFNSSH